MNNYFDIRLRSLFLINCLSMLVPLHADESATTNIEQPKPLNSPGILKLKISEHLANDSFSPAQIDTLLNTT